MNERIPVIVVSGAEGAGKTRLISSLASLAQKQMGATASDETGGAVGILCWSQEPFNLDPLLSPPGAVVVDLYGLCPRCATDDDLLQTLDVLRRHWEVGIAFLELEGGRPAREVADLIAASDSFAPRVVVVTSPVAPTEAPLLDEADVLVIAAGPRGESSVEELLHSLEERALPSPPLLLEEVLADERALEKLVALNPRPRRRTGSFELEDGDAHGGTCGCHSHDEEADAALDRGWCPFLYRAPATGEAIGAALEKLAVPGLRARGLLLDAEGRRTALHFSSGGLHLATRADPLPEVRQYDSLIPGDEPIDFSWLEGASVLHVWLPEGDGDRASLERLEREVDAALAPVILGRDEDGEAASLLQRARVFFEEEHLLEGLTLARRAVALDPESARSLELLARFYHRLGENGRAFALLRRVLEHTPDDLSVLLNLARLHLAYDQLGPAREMADRALRAHPGDPEARFVMGSVLVHAGEHEAGAGFLRELVSTRGEDPELLGLLANVCAELGQIEEAIAHQQKLVEIDPRSEGALYFLGHLLLRAGQPEAALGHLERALDEGNETPWVFLSIGIAQTKLGDDDEAKICYEDSLQLAQSLREEAPDDPSYLLDQLLAEVALGQLEEARPHFEELLEQGGRELPRAREHLALLRGSPGATELARKLDRFRAKH
jgi:tetratricopeptide (TPR) repeat protein